MSRDSFSVDERIAFYNAIVYLDPGREIVIADPEADTLSYSKCIKSHESINGNPTDEELTRALILLNLINNYNYRPEQIEIENSFQIGGRNGTAVRAVQTDICIVGAKNDIEILIEVKRLHDYWGTDDPSIKKQLYDPYENIVKFNKAKYLYHVSVDVPMEKTHFPLKCVGINTGISKSFKEWEQQGRTPHYADIVRFNETPKTGDVFVKLSGEESIANLRIKDLNDSFGIDFIRRTWRSLWDHIWGGTLEDNKKFENFNKILLAKIYDERKTRIGIPYTFQRKVKSGLMQDDIDLANDIDLLYRNAYKEYLSKDKNIELTSIDGVNFKEFSPSIISKCVELLQGISFQKNRYKNVDILGEFYEMVIRDAFKQTKGLFLTHPNLVLFILATLEVEEVVKQRLKKPVEDNRYRLPFIIDPSCGTGTFLIHYMHYVQQFINKNFKKIGSGDEDVKDFIDRQMLGKHAYKWVIDYVYGMDVEPVLATACQINLILHGDGSTNIFNVNGLDDFNEYGKLEVVGSVNILSSNIREKTSFYSKNSLNKFDFIVSNPPFNVNINKTGIESSFVINGKSEAYFLERWYQLLKPGGRIGVVLPESFFSVEDDLAGRMFLYKHFNIKMIVALPNHAFQPHTPTSTSLLFASKKSIKEEEEFAKLWHEYLVKFEERFNKILALFPSKSKVNFETRNRSTTTSIFYLLNKIERSCIKQFGVGFLVFPFYEDEFISNEDNYIRFKKSIKDLLLGIRDRWVLSMVAKEQNYTFYNFSIDNIGYKAGKKGSKDKPNELISVFDKEGKRVYNIKYSHGWDKIDDSDLETVLGISKSLKIWQ